MRNILQPVRIIHGKLHDWWSNKVPLVLERLKNSHSVYLVNTPEHGNLGDHAIAQSEKELLDEIGIPFIEITDQKLREMKFNHCMNIMNGRVILVNGGGNMGMLWPHIDMILQDIVKNNPTSKILMLPNTVFYEDSPKGKEELEKSKSVYNSHKHLKIYAREWISYQKMKTAYRNVALVPDMVLRMNKCQKGVKRSGGILCLRSDREKTITSSQEAIVFEQARQLFGDNVTERDMKIPNKIKIDERDIELEKQYDAFRHSELVITDRLHGMIFSAITGTPCIVIDSKSPKVRGCYEWIKHLDYIRFCEDVSTISEIYNQIEKREYEYKSDNLQPFYESLKKDLLLASRRR